MKISYPQQPTHCTADARAVAPIDATTRRSPVEIDFSTRPLYPTAITLNYGEIGSPFGGGGGGGANQQQQQRSTGTPSSMAGGDAMDTTALSSGGPGSGGGGGGGANGSGGGNNAAVGGQDSRGGSGGGGGSITPVPTSKSAFIELQQNPYNVRGVYHPHPHAHPHFAAAAAAVVNQHHSSPTQHHGNAASLQPHHHDGAGGFGSPRGAMSAYPFPTMHQNSYSGYHIGSYTPQCPSPTKEGKR